MAECKHKLDGQRKQRQPRPMPDVRPKPLHASMRLGRARRARPTVPDCYNITIQELRYGVNRFRNDLSQIATEPQRHVANEPHSGRAVSAVRF
jgi:hypothetical protein